MSWTYTLGPYAAQQTTVTDAGRRNEVRFHLGDVEPGRHLIQDEELDLVLTKTGNNIENSVIEAARHVKGRFAAKSDTETINNPDGTQTVFDWKGVRERMTDLIHERIMSGAPLPVVGGISRDAIEAQDDDTDNLLPRFSGSEPGGPMADDDKFLRVPADLEGRT